MKSLHIADYVSAYRFYGFVYYYGKVPFCMTGAVFAG